MKLRTDDKAKELLGTEPKDTADLIDAYMQFTRDILPDLARSNPRDWPVKEDHCFRRIVLDNICGGVWYEHLNRPAYKHLTRDQATRAVELCHAIADGRADIQELNRQSLMWRGKWRAP